MKETYAEHMKGHIRPEDEPKPKEAPVKKAVAPEPVAEPDTVLVEVYKPVKKGKK